MMLTDHSFLLLRPPPPPVPVPPFLPTNPRSLQGSQDRYTGVVLRKPPHPLQELWQCQSDAVSVQEAEDGPGGEHG